MSLALVLRTRFDAAEIRALVRGVDPDAVVHLPGDIASLAELADQAVEVCARRGSVVDLAVAAAKERWADSAAFLAAVAATPEDRAALAPRFPGAATGSPPPAGDLLSSPLSADRLRKVLTRRPVLWVGAGLSVAAGYPSTDALMAALRAACDEEISPSLPFFEAVDAFVNEMGAGALQRLLQQELGTTCPKGVPRHPTATHRAIAQLAGAGRFRAIVTTNWDPLLERALADEGVPYLLQPLDRNENLPDDGLLRLMKVHGSWDDWRQTVLSGEAYRHFRGRFPFLQSQLDVLLRQNPVLFAGCSLEDPRILEWVEGIPATWAENLQPWAAMLTEKAWANATAKGGARWPAAGSGACWRPTTPRWSAPG